MSLGAGYIVLGKKALASLPRKTISRQTRSSFAALVEE